ncbi:MAG: ankyrin repeat domain-containing protein [Verrucomicrobiota bacterium]|jgi:ankyrin repeat protein|nr:ankyrin repeat domain-containing protein [Verrucomicrobiota bacterium]
MKNLLPTTIAAVVLVGCRESQQLAPAPEAKPAEPVIEAAQSAEFSKPLSEANSALMDAAKRGNIEAIKQHLTDGADVNVKGIGGMAPLHRAAREGHKEASELLITNGADVNAKDKRGRTPLHRTAREGHKEVAELLIAKDADVNAKSESGLFKGETPLDEAIKRKRPEVADLLRKHGGKYSSIAVAAKAGDVEALKKFLADGVDASAIGLLSAAASGGHKEFVELLIANGADVAAKNEYGSTPLHSAATKEIAELLIANGADINAKINDGSSPLLAAAIKGHKEVARLLIANGADVNARSESVLGKDKTALDWAVDQGYTEIADLLRKHGGKTGEELKAEGK